MSLTGEGLVVVTIEVEVVLELDVTVAVELVGSSTALREIGTRFLPPDQIAGCGVLVLPAIGLNPRSNRIECREPSFEMHDP